ncbi:MAG TPA: hypothetical protein VJ813_10510 [Vicinamibacterales bacterium]|nr:hypothetical protein [Vicinamibacterales bacterium]
MAASRVRLVTLITVIVIASGACNRDVPAPPPKTSESPEAAPPTKRVVGPLSEADAAALATMNDGLKRYVDLHKDLEKGLPKLPDEATPEQIDKNQRALEQRIREARKSAKQGELFTPEARPVIRRLLAAVFDGPEGRQLMASILDENPVGMKVGVNMRYPDTVPISTVPPEVLQTLPKLSEDMEYRFIGRHLILLDAHAHLIADYIENALPE